MKIVISPTSPFARKVLIVAAEKRIDCEIIVDSPLALDTKVPELNPLGKVPVLVMDDGAMLYDSNVIAKYLDLRTPVAHLIPLENNNRIEVLRWEALADGVCDAAVLIVLEGRRPPELQSADWVAHQRSKIERGIKAMSLGLGEKKWCVGDAFSLADIAVGCALGYLDLRFKDIDWRGVYPNLARLFEQLAKRPSFQDSVPPA